MTDHGELEILARDVQNSENDPNALVEVKFQKAPNREQKYLEAEPKLLGVTQIMLSVFYMSLITVLWNIYVEPLENTINMCLSSVSIIAGSLAIAAQNLHLPTLKACLGMQVVACVFSVICFWTTVMKTTSYIVNLYTGCWHFSVNSTQHGMFCDSGLDTIDHILLIQMLLQAIEVALSATLAAFCCKVIQCCSPKSNVPVIVVNAPPGHN